MGAARVGGAPHGRAHALDGPTHARGHQALVRARRAPVLAPVQGPARPLQARQQAHHPRGPDARSDRACRHAGALREPRHRRAGLPGPGRALHRRDRALLQRPVVLQGRIQHRPRAGEPALPGVLRVSGPRGARPHSAPRHSRLPHEPPLQRRLRGGGVCPGPRGEHQLRSGRVGARVAARIRVQVVRGLLHQARIPGAAVPRGAGALRAAHHPQRGHAGDLPRGRVVARRSVPPRQDRAARPRGPVAVRPGPGTGHLAGARGAQLRPGAGGPHVDLGAD